jgi:hypothetical protein
LTFIASSIVLVASGSQALPQDQLQPATSSLAEVSVALPEKSALPAGTADLLTHYRFRIEPAIVGQAADASDCKGLDQQALYTTAVSLDAKLNRTCSYKVSLILGKAEGDQKLDANDGIPLTDTDPNADECETKGEGKGQATGALATCPQAQTAKIFYVASKILTTAEMAQLAKIELTLELTKRVVGPQLPNPDTTLPETIPVGKDIDLKVNVKFGADAP